MLLTPRYFPITLAAGAGAWITARGQFISVVSISASTILMGIQDEPPQQIETGLLLDMLGHKYDRIRLENAGAVASNIVVRVSDVRPESVGDAAMLAGILADLNLLIPYTDLVEVGQTAVAQTGVGSTQIITANALNREVEIVADLGNANYVYLGETNGVTQAASFTELAAGASWNRKWTGNIWACGTNGGEIVRASIWR